MLISSLFYTKKKKIQIRIKYSNMHSFLNQSRLLSKVKEGTSFHVKYGKIFVNSQTDIIHNDLIFSFLGKEGGL